MPTYQEMVDEFRCHETDWVRDRRHEVRRAQRRLRVEELALTRVLDERQALDPLPDPSVSTRTARSMTEVARALETRPALAQAAAEGRLSFEQLEPLTRIATPETDAVWAQRGPRCSAFDLQKRARRARKLDAADARRRREAREVRMWREPELGAGAGRWRLADLDGILVEKVLDHLAEQMRPATGQAWAPLAQRHADAFMEVFRTYAEHAECETGKPFRFTIVTHRRVDGSADCDGFEVAPETVDAITPDAWVKERLEDPDGIEITSSRARTALPAHLERHLVERDPHCRVPGCERRRGLQNHHMVPRSYGGVDSIHLIVRVCPYHHRMLVPHGPWWLIGDPEQIDGLRLVHEDELTHARAGPGP